MAAQLFCRLTLLKIIPLSGKTRFSQLTGTKRKSVFIAALWQSVGCTLAVVIVFLEQLCKQLLNENITALHIWSAGPSSEFKNRLCTCNFILVAKQMQYWNNMVFSCIFTRKRHSWRNCLGDQATGSYWSYQEESYHNWPPFFLQSSQRYFCH